MTQVIHKVYTMQDSLLGQIVLSPEPWQFFKKEGFFNNPLSNIPAGVVIVVISTIQALCLCLCVLAIFPTF